MTLPECSRLFFLPLTAATIILTVHTRVYKSVPGTIEINNITTEVIAYTIASDHNNGGAQSESLVPDKESILLDTPKITISPGFVPFSFRKITDCYDVQKSSIKFVSECETQFNNVNAGWCPGYAYQSIQIKRNSMEKERAQSSLKGVNEAWGYSYRFCIPSVIHYTIYELVPYDKIQLNSLAAFNIFVGNSTTPLSKSQYESLWLTETALSFSSILNTGATGYILVKLASDSTTWLCNSRWFNREDNILARRPDYTKMCHTTELTGPFYGGGKGGYSDKDSSNEFWLCSSGNIYKKCYLPTSINNRAAKGSFPDPANDINAWKTTPPVQFYSEYCKDNTYSSDPTMYYSLPNLNEITSTADCSLLSQNTLDKGANCLNSSTSKYCLTSDNTSNNNKGSDRLVISAKIQSWSGVFYSTFNYNRSAVKVECAITFKKCVRLQNQSNVAVEVVTADGCIVHVDFNGTIYNISNGKILTLNGVNPRQTVTIPLTSSSGASTSCFVEFTESEFQKQVQDNQVALPNNTLPNSGGGGGGGASSILGAAGSIIPSVGEAVKEVVASAFCRIVFIGKLCLISQNWGWLVVAFVGSVLIGITALLSVGQPRITLGLSLALFILSFVAQFATWDTDFAWAGIVAALIPISIFVFFLLWKCVCNRRRRAKVHSITEDQETGKDEKTEEQNESNLGNNPNSDASSDYEYKTSRLRHVQHLITHEVVTRKLGHRVEEQKLANSRERHLNNDRRIAVKNDRQEHGHQEQEKGKRKTRQNQVKPDHGREEARQHRNGSTNRGSRSSQRANSSNQKRRSRSRSNVNINSGRINAEERDDSSKRFY